MYRSDVENIIQIRLKELCIQKKFEDKKVLLFGCNEYLEYINNLMHKEGYYLQGIIDNDKRKQGRFYVNIPISAPEKVELGQGTAVLIASRQSKSMAGQIKELSEETEIFFLIDFEKYRRETENRNKFWLEKNYDEEIMKLYQGEAVFYKLKQEETLLILRIPSLGDAFASGLYLGEFEKTYTKGVRVIVASQGARRVLHLFGIRKVEVISEYEMEVLVKYIFFCEKGNEQIICGWFPFLGMMSVYKRIPFPKCWAKYYFKLNDTYRVSLPCIWDKGLKENDFIKKGLVKEKTVILAPYANTVKELPFQFWDALADRLSILDFCVITNISGNQKPVKGTLGIEIPLHQIGSYLEYAGYFVSIRSGLCEVAGRSRCKQIVIFRDTWDMYFFNMHVEDISKNAIQCLYDDNDITKNVNTIINYMIDII